MYIQKIFKTQASALKPSRRSLLPTAIKSGGYKRRFCVVFLQLKSAKENSPHTFKFPLAKLATLSYIFIIIATYLTNIILSLSFL